MKKLTAIVCALLIANTTIASEQYACYKSGKEIVTCSEDSVLNAFHEIKSFKANKTDKGAEIRSNGKTIVAIGAATIAGGSLTGVALQATRGTLVMPEGLIGKIPGLAIVGGVVTMFIGGVVLMFEPSPTADGTFSGYLSSDEGVIELLKMNDEELLSYAKTDSKISLRVMQIQAAIHQALELSNNKK